MVKVLTAPDGSQEAWLTGRGRGRVADIALNNAKEFLVGTLGWPYVEYVHKSRSGSNLGAY